MNKKIFDFDYDAMRKLINYKWPGNVRELQNVVEYAVNMCLSQNISVSDLPLKDYQSFENKDLFIIEPIKDVEARYIYKALSQYGDTLEGKQKAAKALGISLSSLYRKINKYNL